MNTTAARIADFAFEPLPVDAYALRGQVERQELPDLIERVARTHGEQKSVFALLAVRVLREDIAALMFDPATERILLREALQQLTQVLRANDSVSIIAPDEMVLVLTGLPSADLAELAAARLVQCFADPFLVQGAPRRLRGQQ